MVAKDATCMFFNSVWGNQLYFVQGLRVDVCWGPDI